jgi:ribosome-associated protein
MIGDDSNLPVKPAATNAGVEVATGIRVANEHLRLQYARSSGPGGQNVNKVNTKTELWIPVSALMGLTDAAKVRLRQLAGHRLTQADEIHIAADNHRSQEANRAEAFDRLRELLLKAMHEPKRRRKTKISKAAKQRRIDSKKRRGTIKSNRRYDGE